MSVVVVALAIEGCTKPGRVAQVVRGESLRAGVDTFYVTEGSAGRPDTVGQLVQTLERSRIDERNVWLETYRYLSRKGEFTSDSITMDLNTLLPISEVRYSNNGIERVQYDAKSIRTRLQSGAGSTRHDTAVAGPIYSSSVTDALARAFPQTVQDRVRMFLFLPFPAPFEIISADFQNLGTDTIKDRDGRDEACTVVRVDMGGGVTRFWIDRATGRMVRIQGGDTPNSTPTYVRSERGKAGA